MKAKPIQIHWHDKQAIYAIDFQPCQPAQPPDVPEASRGTADTGVMTAEEADDVAMTDTTAGRDPGAIQRFATAGGDNNIRLWTLMDNEQGLPMIRYRATLKRHSANVNCVRFSHDGRVLATAGDDGMVVLWTMAPHAGGAEVEGSAGGGSAPLAFGEEEPCDNQETWVTRHILRLASNDSVLDVAWSPDDRYIVAGLTDNTAQIWDAVEGKRYKSIREHNHFVQGVAWDPLNKFIATQSSDRTVRIYKVTKKKQSGAMAFTMANKVYKMTETGPERPNVEIASSVDQTMDRNVDTVMGSADALMDVEVETATSQTKEPKPKAPPPRSYRMYDEETVITFYRRLSFTPDGAMLFTPLGIQESVAPDPTPAPTSTSVTSSPTKSSSTTAPSTKAANPESRHVVYIHPRNKLTAMPQLFLSGFKKSALGIRCSPIRYELRQDCLDAQGDVYTMFKLPYRMVYAVFSFDSVHIFDSQQASPIAFFTNLHYGTLTDAAWSPDGCRLMVSSTDGFCSVIAFEAGELGTPYTGPIVGPGSRCSAMNPAAAMLLDGQASSVPSSRVDSPVQEMVAAVEDAGQQPVGKPTSVVAPIPPPVASVPPPRVTMPPVVAACEAMLTSSPGASTSTQAAFASSPVVTKRKLDDMEMSTFPVRPAQTADENPFVVESLLVPPKQPLDQVSTAMPQHKKVKRRIQPLLVSTMSGQPVLPLAPAPSAPLPTTLPALSTLSTAPGPMDVSTAPAVPIAMATSVKPKVNPILSAFAKAKTKLPVMQGDEGKENMVQE